MNSKKSKIRIMPIGQPKIHHPFVPTSRKRLTRTAILGIILHTTTALNNILKNSILFSDATIVRIKITKQYNQNHQNSDQVALLS